jgi:hypothetical protein
VLKPGQMLMQRLNFPEYKFRISADTPDGQSLKIFDIIREKYVSLTSEEWVRQHVIRFLVDGKRFPRTLLSVEKQLTVNRLTRRYDILAWSREHKPLVLVECKAPEIAIDQEVFDQAARYNLSLGVAYFVLSNGLDTYCCTLDHENRSYRFLTELPAYEEL